MTAAWFVGARNPVEQDGTLARSTINPIDDDTPAELNAAPEWNQMAVDPHSHAGLDTHYVTGFTQGSIQAAPGAAANLARNDYNAVVDEQVSSAGRAPALEAQGIWGHGTMQYQESLMPAIRDGGALGNTLFITNDQPVQMGAGQPMLPDQVDSSWSGVAQSAAIRRSRLAFAGSLANADRWATL